MWMVATMLLLAVELTVLRLMHHSPFESNIRSRKAEGPKIQPSGRSLREQNNSS